jgi:hypothetical protein
LIQSGRLAFSKAAPAGSSNADVEMTAPAATEADSDATEACSPEIVDPLMEWAMARQLLFPQWPGAPLDEADAAELEAGFRVTNMAMLRQRQSLFQDGGDDYDEIDREYALGLRSPDPIPVAAYGAAGPPPHHPHHPHQIKRREEQEAAAALAAAHDSAGTDVHTYREPHFLPLREFVVHTCLFVLWQRFPGS